MGGWLRTLRPHPRGLGHAQGRGGWREEASPHNSEGLNEALLPEAFGEHRPALHRHQLQTRARTFPDGGGESQVSWTLGVKAEVCLSLPCHCSDLGVTPHFCDELSCVAFSCHQVKTQL